MEKKAKELIDALSSGPVRKYLSDHRHGDIHDIILKHKEILGIPTSRLVEQIAVRKKAREKLPSYYSTEGIIYPPPQNFEQSSSEQTAVFKSNLLATLIKDAVVVDLTGGFGVDTFFFSRAASKVIYVEPDHDLLSLARHNHRVLQAGNIEYFPETADDFLRSRSGPFDIVYADPSRRTRDRKRVMGLADSEPNVVALSKELLTKASWFLVKASPLFDIQSGIEQLPCIRGVFVVSVKNECKEVLFLAERNFEGVAEITAVNIVADTVTETFSFNFPEERQLSLTPSPPLRYLYEPNASILKAGAFKSVAHRFGLNAIHPNTHLYTSDSLVQNFPGKKFHVEAFIRPEKSAITQHFPDGKANVTTRNYPLTPEELKKRTGLKDGGAKFLIGFTGESQKFLAVATRL